MGKEQEQIEETVLDAEALKSISEAVVAGITPVIDEKVKSAVAEATPDTPVSKKVKGGGDDPNEDPADDPEDTPDTDADESKEKRFMRAAIALVRGNTAELAKLNKRALELRAKAGYANTDVSADGGYIVADPEFEAEVEKLSEEYGVAFSDATVRPTERNAIKTNKRGSNVVMYETNEGAAKRGTKLTITQVLVELRKFAAIAIATDELVEDAAIDFWAEVAEGFAEERARIADELVFTDPDADTPGILETPGVIIESVGSAITDIDWDDLMNAEVAVPTKAMRNGKHYMHRSIYNIVRQTKGSDGHYLALPQGGLQTPWGTPITLVDVLPAANEVGSNSPATVFGDLKRVRLYVKRGLVLTQSKDATVHDANNNVVNLYEQDMTALRAVTRMVALVKFPNAFCVIGTGTVS